MRAAYAAQAQGARAAEGAFFTGQGAGAQRAHGHFYNILSVKYEHRTWVHPHAKVFTMATVDTQLMQESRA